VSVTQSLWQRGHADRKKELWSLAKLLLKSCNSESLPHSSSSVSLTFPRERRLQAAGVSKARQQEKKGGISPQ